MPAEEVIARLEGLVHELGLADDAVYVPATVAAEGMDERSDDPQLLLAEVCGHAGALEGWLSCRPRDAVARRQAIALAAHAGIALARVSRVRETERRGAAVRRIAETLQDMLLPVPPVLANTAVAVQYRPAGREAKIGGDFYDVFPLPGGKVLIVVGDVVGKGIEAAVHTSLITQTLRALALQEMGLSRMLDRADEQVRWQDDELIATLWCGLYDPDSGEISFASLGHPPALLLRANGEATRLELEGLPLGLRELTVHPPEIRSRALEARDLLVLYTDGVVETSRDYLAGQEALLRAVSARREEPLQEILQGTMDELLFGAGHFDDAVMLLLRRR